MTTFDRDKVAAALRAKGTIAAAAREMKVDRRRLSEYVNRDEDLRALRAGPKERDTFEVQDDEAVVSTSAESLDGLESILRSHGLDPDEWFAGKMKCWETYDGQRRTTVSFTRIVSMSIISPARHVPALAKGPKVSHPPGVPELIVVEGDHQAPYHDPGLDACTTAFIREMQPTEHIFLGDLIDLPTISRHPDHPAADATPQECVDAGYHILRRRAEAAPNAVRKMLKGNHDWRLEGEQLARSERMHGLHPAGEDVAAISIQRLLHLEKLGVELVEDSRGWEHGEIEVVPGGNGLVVRHGFVTGAGTAAKTMAKLGRSIIVGHGHQKESEFRLVYPKQRLQQGVVAGTMSRNDGLFPHFTINPNWHQGFVTVMRWPDGTFVIEHAIYQNNHLYWRDKRWEAPTP